MCLGSSGQRYKHGTSAQMEVPRLDHQLVPDFSLQITKSGKPCYFQKDGYLLCL